MPKQHNQAILALEDGTVFRGTGFGASTTRTGEARFSTAMSGYQEILTDPASRGLMLAMSYSHIGSTGMNELDAESDRPQVSGLVVEELCEHPSSWRSQQSLHENLAAAGVPGIQGIDTRALTRRLRESGTMRAVLCTDGSLDEAAAVDLARRSDSLKGSKLVSEVTTKQNYLWDPEDRLSREWVVRNPTSPVPYTMEGKDCFVSLPPTRHRLVALDLGIGRGFLSSLRQKGFRVEVVNAFASADEILATNPDGIVLSNGPGDPAALEKIHETVRQLLGRKPILAIGLGHLILAHALGGRTRALHSGHHNGQPVQDLRSGGVAITHQNQGFAVDESSVPSVLEVTHRNLNDGTIEGTRHRELPAISLQCIPSAAPRTNDVFDIFEEFAKMIDQSK